VPGATEVSRSRGASAILLALVAIFAFLAAYGAPQDREAQEKTNLSKDLVVQALELVVNGTKDEAENGLQLLKHAIEISQSNGDAWYYRAIFEKERGQPGNVQYAMDKAKKYGSEALNQGLNPFHLATGPTSGTTTTTSIGPLREKWALVVGISKFQDRKLPHLAYASKDAKDFNTLLLDPNVGRFKADNVHALTDGPVTTKQLKMELNWLARSAQPDDLVVIFLSSHGTPRNRDTAEVNYIATTDTETEPEDNLFSSSIAMTDISDVVRERIKARRTVILLDTCHSGAAVKNAAGTGTAKDTSASDKALDRIRQGLGRAIVTSSAPEEQSYEGKPYDNGYFTHFLLEALKKDKGNVTIEQVYAALKQNVAKAASSIQRKQNPVFSKSEHGEDIIIGAKSGATN
jgi:Caspase domain